MSDVTIWHNPVCSKARRALELLREAGVEPEVRLYLDQPPERGVLESLAARIDGGARALLRRNGELYARLGLDGPGITDAAILDAIAAHPELLERPVVATPHGVALCRPPERVLELLHRKAAAAQGD